MSNIPRALSPSHVVNINDLRPLAQRRLPRAVFDYLDGGADGEVTLAENCNAFNEVIFRPRQAVTVPSVDMRTRVLGFDLSLPAMLAPVGYSRIMHPDGEVAAARAAGKAGTAYILSTISGHRLESVRAATPGPAFYQLYLIGGREVAEGTIERAKAAGFSALVATIDTSIAGQRERDLRNGIKELLGTNPFAKIPYLPQVLARPGWLARFLLDGGVPDLPNVVIPGQGPMKLIDVTAALGQANVTWEDMKWIREIWKGPFVVKGVLGGDDARRAIDAGADAVVVSNHGARQLDCVSPTIRALPEVVAAVNGQIEVLMDGGVRRGSDIVKALCMGARAVLCGRAYAYGLSAAGEAGVTRAIEILRSGTERTLKLLGCASVGALDGSYVSVPKSWS
jgi:isopentenyl diphosphate isomerase/L-lactate dehydrogenase-like FMN-dependent dehydrogenase